jgi:hypothetical protein
MSKKMELTAGALPYDDGSGFQIDIAIRQADGDLEPQLRIDMTHQIPISDWPVARAKIDKMVAAATELKEQQP